MQQSTTNHFKQARKTHVSKPGDLNAPCTCRVRCCGRRALQAGDAAAQSNAASDYPKQPIKIIVGFAAGGGNDLIARIIAQKMTERLGQPTVVENKPGAGAIIGAEAVARAAPDGYTLLVAPPSTFCINPAVYSKLPYDPMTDFEYVSIVAWYPFLLTVNAGHPAKTVKELVAWGKANTAQANYASTSALFQLLTELFKMRTNAPFEHIPFKGSNEMMTAVLSGQVTMAFIDAAPLMGHVKSGKARVLATAGSKRYPELPDVPTLAEAGVPNVVVDGWSGLAASKGTPTAVKEKLAAQIAAIMTLPDVKDRFAKLGVLPGSSTPAEFRAMVEREGTLWKQVAASAKIKLD